jgi:hypothetical protein
MFTWCSGTWDWVLKLIACCVNFLFDKRGFRVDKFTADDEEEEEAEEDESFFNTTLLISCKTT